MNYKAFHKLSYGLYIVASEWNGKKAGYIGNTVFQITSSPQQIAVSCHKNNFSAQIIKNSGIFSISILQKEVSTSLIGIFGFTSGREIEKFKEIKTIRSVTGAPIVTDSALAWFDCRIVNSIDVGSHILFIAEVVESEVISEGEPLTYLYYREKYKMLSPKNAPTYIESSLVETFQQPEVIEKKSEPSVFDNDTYICSICGHTYDPEEGGPRLEFHPAPHSVTSRMIIDAQSAMQERIISDMFFKSK